MRNSLIFDNNRMSELIIKSFLQSKKVVLSSSFVKFVEYSEVVLCVEEHTPDFVILDFTLYRNILDKIISDVREIVPECKVIIVADAVTKLEKNMLYELGIEYIFTRPFIDADFVAVLAD